MSAFRLTVCTALALAGALSVCPVFAQEPGQGLVMEKCVKCHNPARICNALGGKDKTAWRATVARMAAKGAALTAPEQEQAAAYLASLAPKAGPLCGD